jgi:hypothetical protein
VRQTGDGFVLDDREVDQAMRIGEGLKLKFAFAVKSAMAAGRDGGASPDCVMSAVVTEALLLAACCYEGTDDSFRAMVELALAAARRCRTETVQ